MFRLYQRPVFAYFLRMVGDRHDAEELTQETFTRACHAIRRFRGDSSVATWLFGIARRVLLEALRAGLFDRRSNLPSEQLDRAEEPDVAERLDLERAFSRLGLADREALMLVDVLGFEPKEAAPMVGLSAGAFRVRLHRARARLGQEYGR